MMKLKVVEHQKLKVLTYVTTHVEELLVSKIWISCFLRTKSKDIWRSVVDMFLVQTYLFPIWWSCVSLRKKINFKQKKAFSLKISLTKKKVNKPKSLFSLKISLTKKKDSFKQKKPLFVKDKFHQEKSQQTKKPFFVNDKSHQKKN